MLECFKDASLKVLSKGEYLKRPLVADLYI